jgi:hypothetical protein
LYYLLYDVLQIHVETASLALAFLDLAIPLLDSTPCEMSIWILGPIMAAILMIAKHVTKDLLEARVNGLISTLDRVNSLYLFLALKFAIVLMRTTGF